MFHTSGVIPCHKPCVLPLSCFHTCQQCMTPLPDTADPTDQRLKALYRLEGVSGGHLAQPCPKQGQSEQAAWGLGQSYSDHLQGFTAPPDNLLQCLTTVMVKH